MSRQQHRTKSPVCPQSCKGLIGRVLTSGKRILHRRFQQLLRLKQRELILSSWRFYVFSSLRCCALIEILRICKVVSSSSYLVRAAQVFLSWFLMPGCDATAFWVALGALCRGRRQLFRSGQWTQLGFWLFLPHEDSRSTTHWQGELERWRKDIVPWCSMDIFTTYFLAILAIECWIDCSALQSLHDVLYFMGHYASYSLQSQCSASWAKSCSTWESKRQKALTNHSAMSQLDSPYTVRVGGSWSSTRLIMV